MLRKGNFWSTLKFCVSEASNADGKVNFKGSLQINTECNKNKMLIYIDTQVIETG